MRALLQRVLWARVEIGGRAVSETGPGLLVLLGVGRGDGEDSSRQMAARVARIRIFEDREGRMNLSLLDCGGEALVVPQFTLFADTTRGNRPGFTDAAPPDLAEGLYQGFMRDLQGEGVKVKGGVFRAHMVVSLANDGPVTVLLETGTSGG